MVSLRAHFKVAATILLGSRVEADVRHLTSLTIGLRVRVMVVEDEKTMPKHPMVTMLVSEHGYFEVLTIATHEVVVLCSVRHVVRVMGVPTVFTILV